MNGVGRIKDLRAKLPVRPAKLRSRRVKPLALLDNTFRVPPAKTLRARATVVNVAFVQGAKGPRDGLRIKRHL
jgi:hypothetical protein